MTVEQMARHLAVELDVIARLERGPAYAGNRLAWARRIRFLRHRLMAAAGPGYPPILRSARVGFALCPTL